MNETERTTLVQRVMMTAAKARSDATESETIDIAQTFDPTLYGDGPLSLIRVSERMLADGRTPTHTDVYNLLYLATRSATAGLVFGIRWETELPEPAAVLAGLEEI